MLVEMRISDVSGFDLSGLNRYRWNPGHEKVDLSRSDLLFPPFSHVMTGD